MQVRLDNSYDIDVFANKFIEDNIEHIKKIRPPQYRGDSNLSFLSFKELALQEVKKSCYSFVNNNHDTSDIDKYLYATLSSLASEREERQGRAIYVCPGCKFLGNIEVVQESYDGLICSVCQYAVDNCTTAHEKYLHNVFTHYSNNGLKCPDCNRFIPNNFADTIICPYFDCLFAGNTSGLESKQHPRAKRNLEYGLEIMFAGQNYADTEAIVNDDIQYYIGLIEECLQDQETLIEMRSFSATVILKLCMFEAFRNVLSKHPQEMISYLIFMNREAKLQGRIFQEFISIVEKKIPFDFMCNTNKCYVWSLLDDNLSLFDGISIFSSIVDENHAVPNKTSEIYVGSRKATYCRPYYIGKLVSIKSKSNKSLLSSVKEYAFNKIFLSDDVLPGTEVIVEHMRIPPHYQMGGMVYLNRTRRKLVDKLYFKLNAKKRPVNAKRALSPI